MKWSPHSGCFTFYTLLCNHRRYIHLIVSSRIALTTWHRLRRLEQWSDRMIYIGLPMSFHQDLCRSLTFFSQIWCTTTMQLPGMDHKGGLRFSPQWSQWPWWSQWSQWSWWSWWSWWSQWWCSGCCCGDKRRLHGGDGEQPWLLTAAGLSRSWSEPSPCQGNMVFNSKAWPIWTGLAIWNVQEKSAKLLSQAWGLVGKTSQFPLIQDEFGATLSGMMGALAEIQKKGDSMLAGIRRQREVLHSQFNSHLALREAICSHSPIGTCRCWTNWKSGRRWLRRGGRRRRWCKGWVRSASSSPSESESESASELILANSSSLHFQDYSIVFALLFGLSLQLKY